MPNIKNILIFIGIATVFILLYIFFIKKPATEEGSLSSSATVLVPDSASPPSTPSLSNMSPDSLVTKDFLTLLLSVKNIKLDDSIFSGVAFANLRDSSITLIPDGTEGRPNPFAPLGNDNISPPPSATSTTSPVVPREGNAN